MDGASIAATLTGVEIFYADNNPKDRPIMEGASTTSSTSSVDGRTGSDYLSRGTFTTSQHQQNDASSLLTGFAGANGFSNDVGTSFDLNEFPSLGSSVGGGTSNGLAAAMREQQQLLAQQQSMQVPPPLQYSSPSTTTSRSASLYVQAMTGTNGNNFSMVNEDFPALGVGNSGSGGLSGMSNTNPSGALNVSSLLSNSSPFQLNSNPGDNNMYIAKSGLETGTSQLEGHAGLLGGAGLGNVSSAPIPVATLPSNVPAGNALGGDFGLLGLLGIIRMTDADRNALALGSDLQLLGLNLGSTEQIFGTFASPWSESNTGSKEPHYQLPMCYYMQPPALKTGHLSKFQLETLFYIFYALPKDVLQAYAAQELYSREWRYHGELKLWFKRAGPSDGVSSNFSSSGSPQFLYFDINAWERRLFNGSMNQNITSGFVPEEEVRVKFSTS